MSEKKSLYGVLGVPAGASDAELRSAWEERRRQLETQMAGLDGGTPELAEELRNQSAFLRHAGEVLCSPERRRRYDRTLAAPAPAPEVPALPRAGGGILRPLLLVAVLAAAAVGWLRHPGNETPAPVPAAAADPATASEAAAAITADAGPALEPPTAQELPISRRPDGGADETAPLTSAPAPAPAARYQVEINAANGPLLKKLVGAVYAVVGGKGFGTGILVDRERLLTNCHVVAGNRGQGPLYAVNAVTREKTEITEVAWLDHEDACLVRAPGLTGSPVVVALQSPTQIGAHTHNIGFVRGQLGSSQGELLGWARRFGQTFMVTSNYCDHGVSGGPLVDDDGRLIGLTSGGPASRAYCLSVNLETVDKLRLERLKPLDQFPAGYTSNISRPG